MKRIVYAKQTSKSLSFRLLKTYLGKIFFWRGILRKNKTASAVFIIVALLFASPYVYNAIKPNQGEAWWNDLWGYRMVANVSNSGSNLSQYPVEISIDTEEQIDAGKMQSDCDDIRVTDRDGNLLPIWIETGGKGCNTSSTSVWVKAPSIPSTGTTLFVYYGNPQAQSMQNGEMVFDFFDDFSTNTLGTKWVGDTDNFSISDGTLIPTNTNYRIQTSQTFTGDYEVITRIDTDTGGNNGFQVAGFFESNSNSYGTLNHGNATNWYTRNDSTWTSKGSFTWTQWVRVRNKVVGTAGSVSLTGESSGSSSTTDTNGGISGESVALGRRYDNGNYNQSLDASWDFLFVKKAVATEPSVSLGTEQVSHGPVLYFAFDEGYGTSAKDTSQYKAVGTFSGTGGPTWKPDSACVVGKCLYFDGSDTDNNQTVLLSQSSTSPQNLMGDMTISAWIKPTSNYDDTSEAIVRNGQGANQVYAMYYNPTAQRPYFSWYDGSFKAVQGTDGSAPLNQWTHVTMVRDGTSLKIYINGKLTNTDTVTAPTVASNSLAIGRTNNAAVPQDYTGFLDELKIYDFAMTDAQALANFNSRGGNLGSAAVFGASDTDANLSNGLVAYWKMDEASWDGTSGEVIDSSGNGNAGTATNALTSGGKFGNGGSFDGDSDYISITDSTSLSPSTQITTSAWVKPSLIEGQRRDVIYANAGYFLGINSNGTAVSYIHNGAWVQTNGGSVPLDEWSMISSTYDGQTLTTYLNGVAVNSTSVTGTISNPSNIKIGSNPAGNGEEFEGNIDEVRIYNRALSPSEISQLYNFAPGPLAYYDFEEGQGTTINDKSGNNYSGTLSSGTSWGQGKYGKGIDFVPGKQASITGASGELPSTITAEAWVDYDGVDTSGFNRVVARGWVGDGWLLGVYANGSGEQRVWCGIGQDSTQYAATAVVKPGKIHIAMSYDGAVVRCYVNGKLIATNTNAPDDASLDTTSNIVIASTSITNPINIDEVRIYNYARTAQQIVSDMNAGHPSVGSPVASAVEHYKFDEGYGTIAHSVGSNPISGVITGASWTSNGRFGKALQFNKQEQDYVTISDTTGSPLDVGHPGLTLSAWIYPTELESGQTYAVINKNGPYLFWLNGTNSNVYTGLYNGSWTFIGSPSNSITTNKWQHIMMTYDGTTRTIYINGEVATTDTSFTGEVSDTNAAVSIGRDSCCSGRNYFDGMIDEVKIYNFALTPEQAKLEYNQGKSIVLGALSDTSGLSGGSIASNSASAEYCIPGDASPCSGPIARYDFEEGQGSTVNDTSGNEYSGSWQGTIGNQWKAGKVGKAGNLNGSTTYVSVSDPSDGGLDFGSATDFSVEFWVKLENLSTQNLIGKRISGSPGIRSGWMLRKGSSDRLRLIMDDSSNSVADSAFSSFAFTANTWYHVAVTFDRDGSATAYINGNQIGALTISSIGDISNGSNFTMGATSDGTGSGAGLIDNVRLYNYLRTPSQVAWSYNRGAPVGHWKFDECQGTVVNDASGNSLNGAITIGDSGSQTTAGTCSSPTDGTGSWYNGKSGRYNSALSVDGTDDYASISDNALLDMSYHTIAAWIKREGSGSQYLIERNNSVFYVRLEANSTLCYWLATLGTNWTCTTKSIPSGSWHHIAVSWDGTTKRLYIDGVLEATESYTGGTLNTSAQPINIGVRINSGTPTGYFEGQIDDVRLYNYPLTAAQLKQVYNDGSSVRFGPIGEL